MSQAHEARSRSTRGRDLKRRKYVELEVGSGEFFSVRKGVDFQILYLRGLIPTPLLAAVDRLQDVRKTAETAGVIKALETLSAEDRALFMDLLRACALAVVVDPKLTDSKFAAAKDEDLLWVGGYSDIPDEIKLQEARGRRVSEEGDVPDAYLMKIYRYVLGEVAPAHMESAAADDFRTPESQPDDSSRPDSGEVRHAAVAPARDRVEDAVAEATAAGRVVEFVGNA